MAILESDPITLKRTVEGYIDIVNFGFESGLTAFRLGVEDRLRLVKGAWFANLAAGVDYYGVIFGKVYRETTARDEFRQAILGTPGAVEVTSLILDLNDSTRLLTVDWAASVEFSDTLVTGTLPISA